MGVTLAVCRADWRAIERSPALSRDLPPDKLATQAILIDHLCYVDPQVTGTLQAYKVPVATKNILGRNLRPLPTRCQAVDLTRQKGFLGFRCIVVILRYSSDGGVWRLESLSG